MIVPPVRRLKPVALSVAIALGTLSAAEIAAQGIAYNPQTIVTVDLGKAAGHSERISPVAPITARPGGGAFIQWAASANWNNGDRCQSATTTFITTVGADGRAIGTDINLGTGQPGGVEATGSGFSYYIWDKDKLSFGVRNASGGSVGEAVVMNHRAAADCGWYDPKPFPRVEGLTFDPAGSQRWGWEVPYLPYSHGRGDIAFGNNRFSTAFSVSNNFQRQQGQAPDTHSGDAYIFYDASGANAVMPSRWTRPQKLRFSW